jgi:hypothetical protein
VAPITSARRFSFEVPATVHDPLMITKRAPWKTDPAGPLAYVYIDDQDELFDTDIEKRSAQGDECRTLNGLSGVE